MTKYYSRSKQKFVDIEQMPDQYVRNAFVKMCGEETKIYVNWKKLAEDNFISGVDDLDKIESLTKENEKLKNRQYNSHDKDGRINLYYKEYAKLAKERDEWKEKSMNMIEKSTHTELEMENVRLVQQLEHDEHQVGKYDDLKRQTDVLVKDNSELRFQIQQVDRNQTVSKEAYDIAWDNNKILKNKYEELRKTYAVLLEDYNTDTGRGVWKDRYEHELKMAEYWKDAFYKKDVIKGCGYTFSEIPNDTDGQEFVDNMKKYFNKKSYKMRVRGQHVKPELRGTGVTSHGQNIDESTHLRVYIDVK